MSPRNLLIALAAVCFFQARAVQFSVTDYGAQVGGDSEADAISNNGTIVGQGPDGIFIAQNGVVSAMADYGQVRIRRINANNLIVGSYLADDGQFHAAAWHYDFATNWMLLIDLNSTHSAALGVNDSGYVVGGFTRDGIDEAFSYRAGGAGPIGGLSEAAAINSSEVIVGSIGETGGHSHAASLAFGTVTDLGSIGLDSRAVDINSFGQILVNDFADYFGGLGPSRAYIVESGFRIDLGNLGQPYIVAKAINNRGDVVGTSRDVAGVDHAFFYRFDDDQMVNLDSVVPPNSGYTSFEVTGINDSDQLSATGLTLSGATHALLLSPVQTISGTVSLQNRSGPVAGTVVIVEIRTPGTVTSVESHTVTLDAGGLFSFTSNLPAGTYDIAVKASHWLRSTVHSQAVGTFGLRSLSFSLANGDINGDNLVSLTDFAILRAAFGSSAGDSNWNPDADLNGDGLVNLSDFGILRTNFGQRGDR